MNMDIEEETLENISPDFLDIIEYQAALNQKITNYCNDFNYHSPNIKNVVEFENTVEFSTLRYNGSDNISGTIIFDKHTSKPIKIDEYEKQYLKDLKG